MLVCCTGGEAGDILNPAMDTPEVRADIANVRRRGAGDRPRRSSATTRWCGSATATRGCPTSPANADPRCFAGRRPRRGGRAAGGDHPPRAPARDDHVPRRQEGYPHPDHLRVHDISDHRVRRGRRSRALPRRRRAVAAAEALLHDVVDGSASWRCTRRCSSSAWSRRSTSAGSSSRPTPRTTGIAGHDAIEISAYYGHRKGALLAHATQIDPESPFWFALPDDVAATRVPVRRLHPRPQLGRQRAA